MTRLTITIVAFALLTLLPACDFEATEEECAAACDNVESVGRTELDGQIDSSKELAEAGEDGRTMARNMAGAMMDAIKDECLKQCKEKGTRKQAECLAATKSVEDINKCM